MSKYEHLFSPLKIAGITVKNRYAVGPMGANYLYGEKGCYTEDGVDYFTDRARGGFGLIVTGSNVANLTVDPFDPINGNPNPAYAPGKFMVNAQELRDHLEKNGALFHTTTDSEVIAYCIARERITSKTVEEAILKTAGMIRGAYGLVIASPRKLIGVRDPLGLKPLCLGKRDNAYILASESCALQSVGAEFVRDIRPGEIITITEQGISSDYTLCQEKKAHCIFEYIYFARLDSTMDNINIYDARIRAGAALAKSYPVEADLVCGVPDSGIPAAKGFSEASGIPFGLAFYKNSYVGRTFIKPTQKERENSVRLKLNVLESVVKGKRIVLVDDSIVRGTTIANLIHMLKKAGAVSVHVRISSPPFLYPCYFGTDIPSNKQLIASSHSTEEICSMIGADSLGYMKIEDLQSMVGDLPICKSCFDNQYPMKIR